MSGPNSTRTDVLVSMLSWHGIASGVLRPGAVSGPIEERIPPTGRWRIVSLNPSPALKATLSPSDGEGRGEGADRARGGSWGGEGTASSPGKPGTRPSPPSICESAWSKSRRAQTPDGLARTPSLWLVQTEETVARWGWYDNPGPRRVGLVGWRDLGPGDRDGRKVVRGFQHPALRWQLPGYHQAVGFRGRNCQPSPG